MKNAAAENEILIWGAGGISLGQLSPGFIRSGITPVVILKKRDKLLEKKIEKELSKHYYFIVDKDKRIHKTASPIIIKQENINDVLSHCITSCVWITAIGAKNVLSLVQIFSEAIELKSCTSQKVQLILCENTPYKVNLAAMLRQGILQNMEEKKVKDYFTNNVMISEAVNYWAIPGEDFKPELHINIQWEAGPVLIDADAIYLADPLKSAIENKVFIPVKNFQLHKKLKVGLQLHAYEAINYLGALWGCTEMKEALANRDVINIVNSSLREIVDCLKEENRNDGAFIDECYRSVMLMLQEMQGNDMITRNCRDPFRKLDPGERMLYPSFLVAKHNRDLNPISKIVASVLYYNDCLNLYHQNNLKDPIYSTLFTYAKKSELEGYSETGQIILAIRKEAPVLAELVEANYKYIVNRKRSDYGISNIW